MPALHAPWLEEDIETLKRLWREGKTGTQIRGLLIGAHTRSSVIGKVHRLKLPPRLSPHAENRPPKPKKQKTKRVTLPPLPINRPDIVDSTDAVILKSAAWLPLQISVPKRMADLGDIGKTGRLGECRWPVGNQPMLFCACATYEVYCPTHATLAHRKAFAA